MLPLLVVGEGPKVSCWAGAKQGPGLNLGATWLGGRGGGWLGGTHISVAPMAGAVS